jgi:hypothetical protein
MCARHVQHSKGRLEMKVIRLAAVLAVAAILAMTAVAMGKGPGGGGGWGCGSSYVRMYNPNSEVSFDGTISKITRVETIKGASPGIHIMVTGQDPCTASPIHLGPAWFLDNQDIKLSVGDKVEIVGSKVKLGDENVIIAREVRKGDDILVLRDKSGVPYWAGWRRMKK